MMVWTDRFDSWQEQQIHPFPIASKPALLQKVLGYHEKELFPPSPRILLLVSGWKIVVAESK
jgi:hypothetical protein